MTSKQKARSDYQRSLKSLDTEERIDLAFYRPVGYAWAKLAERLGVSPNAITIASIFLGVGGGVLFYFSDIWLNIIGMVLLVWANSFDSADGQLARLTGQYSRLGRILDGLSGDFWFLAIYLAIVLRENATVSVFEARHWIMWCLVVLAAISHGKQAAMADYYRQFHLYFLKGAKGSELDRSEDLDRHEGESVWRRMVANLYYLYTRQQEATAPAMQRLRRELALRYPDGDIPAAFRADFRKLSLPLMKYTNILTFNWRIITLFVTLFIGEPWIFPAMEVTVGNALLVYMISRHERLCRLLTSRLQNGEY